jgi:hypothetical protein
MAWIGVVLAADGVRAWDGLEAVRQAVLGLGTWGVLAVLLRRELPLVRAQTMVVVALATAVEYTFSPLLEAYVYRLGTVPLFVPPGHGLVYLAALALGRGRLIGAAPRVAAAVTAVVGGAWAVVGLLDAGRPDVLGAFWFGCLVLFLAWGPSRPLYVGAFVVVSYLELLGTRLGTWAWAAHDPVLGVVGQGNPPSGAAGGTAGSTCTRCSSPRGCSRSSAGSGPASRRQDERRVARTVSCRSPLVASALPPNGPSTPSSEVNRPPASTTTGTSAAMS